MSGSDEAAFAEMLDAHQAGLEREALEAEERSWTVAARPGAKREQILVSGLRVGDYITNDGVRWAIIRELRGPYIRVRPRQPGCAQETIKILFEIPEPITVSGETMFWIERPARASVCRARGEL